MKTEVTATVQDAASERREAFRRSQPAAYRKETAMPTSATANALPFRIAALILLLAAGAAALAQTPVDQDGNPIGPVLGDIEGADDVTLLSAEELGTLVGPIALYPDDLLAVVLPASTFPLEIVQAVRYLDDLENDSSLKPDESWDDSVVALLNYPEVLRMMSDDLDWTWRLGEAVVAQQADVIAAVESFRDRAYAAGNLKSDDKQTVTRTADDVIEIDPVDDDVIYVPYYEPAEVVVYQPRPVYYYYPRAYPVYYYPYPAGHYFVSSPFWGVTTAFGIGWSDYYLRVYHHSYHGHPYFGWNYYGSYWRRPSIYVFNSYYGTYGYRRPHDRYRYGSYWRPRHYGGARPGHYSTRSRYYSNRRRSSSDDGYANREQRDQRRDYRRDGSRDGRDERRDRRRERRDGGSGALPLQGGEDRVARRDRRDDTQPGRRAGRSATGDNEIRFRTREGVADRRDARRNADRRRSGAGSATPRAERRSDPRPAAERRSNPRPAAERRGNVPAAAERRRSAPPANGVRREANRGNAARRDEIRREPGVRPASRPAPAPRATVDRSSNYRASPRSADRSRAAAPPRRVAPPRASAPPRRSAPASRPAPVSRPAPASRPSPVSRPAPSQGSRPSAPPRRASGNAAPRPPASAPRSSGNKGRSGPRRDRRHH